MSGNPYRVQQDFGKIAVMNFAVQNVSALPSDPVAGQLIFNTVTNLLDICDNEGFGGSISGGAAKLNTARAIYGNDFDGTTALTAIISSAFGGTGNGFTKFTGATTLERTYTLPNADATLLYQGAAGSLATLSVSSAVSDLLSIVSAASSSSTAGANITLSCDDGAALASGDRLGTLAFGGSYDASNTLASSARIISFTAEAWTSSARGSRIAFHTTTIGSTTPAVGMALENDKALSLYGSKIRYSGSTFYITKIGSPNDTIIATFTDSSASFNQSIIVPNNRSIRTTTTADEYFNLQAYSNTSSSYLTFATITAGTTPSVRFSQPSGGVLTWNAGAIGNITPSTGAFTTLSASTSILASFLTVSKAVFTDADGFLSSTGIVGVDQGGTGISSATPYAVICGGTSTTEDLQPLASTGNAGQVLTSNGDGALPSFQNGGRLPCVEVTDASQTMSANTSYIANRGSLVTLPLPATSAIGDVVEVLYKGAGGWKISQGSGQQIRIGSVTTTSGATGTLSSTTAGDSIMLKCITANTLWTAISVVGNPQEA